MTGPRWVVHPIFLAAAFVLNLALESEVEVAGFIRPLAVAAAIATLLTLIFWASFRNRWDGALAASITILLMISFVPVYRAWQILQSAFGPSAAVVIFAAVVAGLGASVLILTLRARSGRPAPRPSAAFLNAFTAVLVALVLLSYTVPHVPVVLERLSEPRPPAAVAPPGPLPDIFVVLLDGYPDKQVLDRRFGINNSSFLDQLSGWDFEVAVNSRSNYESTSLTLASMFQMDYVDGIPAIRPLMGQAGTRHDLLRHAANSGAAFAILRAAGYQIVATMPDHEHVTLRDAADRYLNHGELVDIERRLLERTWLLDLLSPLAPNISASALRDRIVHTFDDLDTLAVEEGEHPMFAFIHVPAPHLPVVLDAQGNLNGLASKRFESDTPSGIELDSPEFRALYAAELTYLNRRTLRAIDALVHSRDTNPPVVIVMSDHGYTHDLAHGSVADRFGNLFAAFTPGAPELFASGATPVNILPILFNRYLGTDIPQSRDRFFISPNAFNSPLIMTEVASDSMETPVRAPAESPSSGG